MSTSNDTPASADRLTGPEPFEVVIIGAGYAGVMAANRLSDRAGDDEPRADGRARTSRSRNAGHRPGLRPMRVRLVNPRAEFTERIRLHEALVDGVEPTIPLTELLGAHVELVIARARLIDREAGLVHLDDGRTLPFDRVVLATGSTTVAPAGALPLSTLEHLRALKTPFEATRTAPNGRVRVVGGGATGIEIAAELAHAGLTTEIVDSGTVGGTLGSSAQHHVRAALVKLGCRVTDGVRVRMPEAAVTGAVVGTGAGHTAKLGPEPEPEPAASHGAEETAAFTIWATGFAPVTVPITPPIALAPDGRIVVDGELRSRDDARLLAAGDCAAVPAPQVRASCATALPLGAGVGDTILADHAGHRAAPVHVGFVGRCLSLGRDRGVLEFTTPVDRPIGPFLGSRPGRFVKDWVMNRTTFWLRGEAARSGWYRGARGPALSEDRM